MEFTNRQTAFSILYAAIHDYREGRKPIPQSFKNALSKLMATKYHTLSGFKRNAR